MGRIILVIVGGAAIAALAACLIWLVERYVL